VPIFLCVSLYARESEFPPKLERKSKSFLTLSSHTRHSSVAKMLATTRTARSLSPLFVAKRREAAGGGGGRRPSSSSHDARKSPFFFSSGEGCLGRRRHHARKVRSSSSSSDDSKEEEEKNDDDDDSKYDFIEEISDENLLTTSLNRAISDEDYTLAAKLSKRLQAVQNLNGARDAREILLDWRMLGIAEWMAARAEALGFRFPTGIQRKSTSAFLDGDRLIVISAQTGTGKTLAYLVPAVDQMDFVGRQMLQILVVVPTRELVVQTTMLAYKLTGGSISRGVPGDQGNMFNYFGPQGLVVKGVFEQRHVADPDPGLATAEIVVGTPDELAELKRRGIVEVDLASHIICDEADALFENHKDAMRELLKPSPYVPVMETRQICLVGVSIANDSFLREVREAVPFYDPTIIQTQAIDYEGQGLEERKKDIEKDVEEVLEGLAKLGGGGGGGGGGKGSTSSAEGASDISDSSNDNSDSRNSSVGGNKRLPPNIHHRVLYSEPGRKLVTLCRQIRADAIAAGEDKPPPRTLVFVKDAPAAEVVAGPLRKALWGAHTLVTLLPEGREALRVVEDFDKGKASIMVCTAQVSRGLDLRNVAHVYSLDVPNAKEYVHRAGRCGRVGAVDPGVVTSIVSDEEKDSYENVVEELQIKSEEIETIDVEKMGRGTDDEEEALAQLQRLLDDNFYLLDTKQLNIASLEKALAIEPEVLDYGDGDDFDDEEKDEK
jgi:superfamily II DNA/RNA helicase